MKSKISFAVICTMMLCLCFSKKVIAQQDQTISPNTSTARTGGGQPANNYTYKVFEAPNKMFGYDIYQDGRIIFHQPAAIRYSDNMPANQTPVQNARFDPHIKANGFSKEVFAQNAASLSIGKIRKRSAPALTDDEIRQAMTDNNPNTIIKH
jgi:hypothetical protein